MNAGATSICQIGVVRVVDGVVVDTWRTLVVPEARFDRYDIGCIASVRRMSLSARSSPDWSRPHELGRRLEGLFLASHTGFDRCALDVAMDRHGLPPLRVTWLDSVRVAKRLGIEFRHHDAAEAAMVAARIVVRACRDAGTSVQD